MFAGAGGWGVGVWGVFCEQVSGPVVSRSVGTGSGTKPLCSFVSEALPFRLLVKRCQNGTELNLE